MSDHDRYIPGVPCWVDSSQADPQAAVAFYRQLFGWEAQNVMPPGSGGEYHVATIRQEPVAGIGSQPEGSAPKPAWDTYIWVDSADETADRVRAAGGTVLSEPSDVGPFGRTAVFADPGGATFSIWQAGEHRGATVVNEHGAVNFNNLHTKDPERAEAFYAAVFGWDLLRAGESMLGWALPAYGDFLEGLRPGMREQMKTMGAPDRFEEVVAAVVPIAGDEPEHWSVTF